MGFRGGGQIDPPPSIFWFSSTPAGIGLTFITGKIYATLLVPFCDIGAYLVLSCLTNMLQSEGKNHEIMKFS